MADAGDSSGFLSRWSRRKTLVREGQPLAPEPEAEANNANETSATESIAASSLVDAAASAREPTTETGDQAHDVTPLVTMDDVAQLTRESNYGKFVSRRVDPEVRNAALKKLFTDPHYNVMDGLDTYIDDYTQYEPISKSMLRQMVQARALGMLDDELEEQPKPDVLPNTLAPDAAPGALVPEPPSPTATHEDTDLQLQPDDAAGLSSVGEGVVGPDEQLKPDRRIDPTDA